MTRFILILLIKEGRSKGAVLADMAAEYAQRHGIQGK